MVIIFFSGNLHKAREISQILRNCEVRLYSEFVEKFSIEESGKTFAQNAKIKLLGLKARLEECAFDSVKFGGRRVILMAEDSGICIEALNGRPGIYSARYGGNSPLDLHSADFANLGRFADFSPVSHPKFAKNHESQTENPSVVDSARGAESSEKIQLKKPIKSFCYFWLLPKVESPLLLNYNQPNKVDLQNLRGKLQICHSEHPFCHSERSEESQKNNNRDSSVASLPQNDNIKDFAESSPDSADFLNNMRVINELKSLNIAESSAYFVSCIACCEISPKSQNLVQNAQILTAHGFLNGKVITQIKGTNGFGYDPIFVPNGFNQTLGELDAVAKNALSHRASALKLMALLLQ